jgi:cytoskeletal protein RodZ
MLRRARELRGLTLERIARETKIPQRHLEALERNNLAAIPSGFYGRAELRTYAQAVGLDQRLALAELDSALAPPEIREARETRPSKASTMSPLPFVAMAAVAIAIAGALFVRANVEPAPQLTPVVDSGPTGGSVPEPSVTSLPPAPAPALVTPEAAASAVASNVAVEPAAQAPAAAATVTELVVTTEPEGARVTVNGIGWGASPARIQYLEPGPKRIRVSKEGYAAVERVLQVDQGRRQTLSIRLEPAQ